MAAFLAWAVLLRSAARRPTLWVTGLAATLAGPLILGLAPTPVLADAGRATALLASWTPALLLLGHLGPLLMLDRLGEFLRLVPPTARAVAELAAFVSSATGLLLAFGLGLTLAAGRIVLPAPTALTSAVHLAAIAFAILRAPLPTLTRLLVFVAAAWIVPALFRGGGVVGTLCILLDASSPARAPIPQLAAIAALVLLGRLLDSPRVAHA